MRRSLPALLAVLFVSGLSAFPLHASDHETNAREILDAATPETRREALITSSLQDAPALLQAMIHDLTPGTPEEYRRIPFIWRVAVAASKANEPEHLRAILDLSLPKNNESLRDWQAVVIGGGVINGVSLQGIWPSERIHQILTGDDALRARWQRSLVLAAAMTDDEKVPYPTRYDALRMIALRPWAECRDQLTKYLAKEVNSELQQGAISGLSDTKHPAVAELLITHLPQFSGGNRDLAIEALLRDDQRKTAFRKAVKSGTVRDLPADVARKLAE